MACVTPVRRLADREVTTLDGLPADVRSRWVDALVDSGGSQCGFCTPGIVMRLAALGPGEPGERVDRSLLAHLCRCTGWQTIREAARRALREESPVASGAAGGGPAGLRPAASGPGHRDFDAASVRAGLEGGVPQRVGPDIVIGRGGFADDTSPADALVAVPDAEGGYAVAASLGAARTRAGKVQGRSSGLPLDYPLAVPPGSWDLTLMTTYVEPGYVEPDASWCRPGGEPAPPCANGGAFGGKLASPVAGDARRLADEHGRPVRVLWSREDVVRRGPKRPPVAAGIDRLGSGVLRVGVPPAGPDAADWAEVEEKVASVAPGMTLEPVPLEGPPVSFDLRGSVWAEAAVLVAAARSEAAAGPGGEVTVSVTVPGGGGAQVCLRPDGPIEVTVDAGAVLDAVVLRSYCVGAVHQALGWVRSEGIAVGPDGAVRDLTVRSFGILEARAMPPVTVHLESGTGPPVNGSDAVFAAVAAAAWLADGLPDRWPTRRGTS